MLIRTQKISVYSLTIGMFVCKLDRAWADSNYPLEGFHIKSADEIRKLKFICRYVFIDETLTLATEKNPSRIQIKENLAIPVKKSIKVPNQQKYDNVVPLNKVLKKAIKNHQQLHQTVNYLFTHIHNHNIVKINQIKAVLSATVSNMIENPDALMWIARTRNNDDYSYNFVLKQTIWALAVARQIGMNQTDMERLALASILSGIGKSKLPKDILLNEQKLNVQQFLIYKKHVDLTVNILKNIKDVHPQIIHIIQNHCEYIDGSGYPNKLKGDDIYLASQIIGLAAFYERSSTPRDLTRAISPNEALDEINSNKGKKFTAELVEQFVQAIGIYPTGTLVQLNNGEIAVIVESKEDKKQQQRLNPNIIVLRNTMDEKIKKQHVIKLSATEDSLKIVQSLPLGIQDIDVNEINEAVYKYNHSWDLKRIIGF